MNVHYIEIGDSRALMHYRKSVVTFLDDNKK